MADIGGTNVKLLVTGETEPRKLKSGPKLTPELMMSGIKQLIPDWEYDAVSIGYPGPVLDGRPVSDPRNLGSSWVGFDFSAAFGRPVKIMNDAAMQAIGSYQSGKMLFLGLGTGLGAAMIIDGLVEPMELGHLHYKKGTYEDYVGQRGLERNGKKQWRLDVADVVGHLIAALQPSDTVIGGGNVCKLKELPPRCRAGENANAFEGGFRLWASEDSEGTRVRVRSLIGRPGMSIIDEWRAGEPARKRPAWKALEDHYKKLRDIHLRKFFADDLGRGQRMAVEAVGVYLDYSKNRISDKTLKLLLDLAEQSGLRARIDAMFRGEKINTTENRAALHVVLRAPEGTSITVDGQNVVPEVHAVLNKMADFSQRVRGGEWKGYSGKRIRNVINIGIGGSDLGPVMAYEALKYYSDRAMTFRFVSNIDGTDLVEAARDLDPAETLFIVSSKTFTTLETMTNAHSAREWLLRGTGRRRQGDRQTLRRGVDKRFEGFRIRH